MPNDTVKIFDKEILVTRKPVNYYLTIVIISIIAITLSTIIIIQDLDSRDSILIFFIFFFIGLIFYANFGQYLALITLYDHRIEVKYIFPLNKSFVFEFDKISDLDFKDIPPFYQHRERWYVGGKWLYFKNEKGEACQFKYNINNSDDKKLLEELRKKIM